MAKNNIMTGARAKIMINGNVVGLFVNCSWSNRQNKQPVHVLGRYSPAEIVPLSQEAVSLVLTGYRVVNAGPYKVANATLLKDLLNENDFVVQVIDRQTGKIIFRAVGCRVVAWSSGVATGGLTDIRVDIVALRCEDEFGIDLGGDNESASAANLLDGTGIS